MGEAGGQTVICTITPDAAVTGGSYGVQLCVENTNLTAADDNMFCPVKRDNASATYADFLTYDATTLIPAESAAGRIYSAGSGYAQRTGYTIFSKFGIGKAVMPLPVELLYFDANRNGNSVEVTWSTASEFNSDYFVIQRSKDGITFEDVVLVDAAGNSSVIKNYFSEDYDPYSGVSYYRLRQVDNDGKFAFSNIVAVNFDPEGGITVYPNPTFGPFNVKLDAKAGDEILVVVRDITGREFYSKLVIMSNDSEVIAIDPAGKIAAGIYVAVAASNNAIYEKKVVIK
ncbi:MAG: T9SS type A sorting domain-containing protein [Bacteroidetes bacterium]|nr:MAG: T9SS type A sorting domain-containing protein [Bacteroidota bacterium]